MKLIETVIKERLTLGSKERIHLSKKPINKIEDAEVIRGVHGKPRGFWYGFGDNWINFIKYGVTFDGGGGESLKDVMGPNIYIYKVYLDTSDIVVLDTKESYVSFTNKYSTRSDYPYNINWDAVRKDYKGIEFPNYEQLGVGNWGYSDIEYKWTYTIDVNSGCIWDNRAVKKIRLL